MELPVEAPAPGECGRCGGGNSPEARFCQHCGTPLGTPDPIDRHEGLWVPEVSAGAPIVTAVVCELSPLAPDEGETARNADGALEVPSEDLERVRELLERSGAAVEEVPGAQAALAAVFGPEPAGGEGPIRAVRAAAEARETVSERPGGPAFRAGVGTAEIVGDGPGAEVLWRQRVVDLATRLQRMAELGDVVVAESVYRRVGTAAELGPLRPNAPAAEAPGGPLRLIEASPDPATVALGTTAIVGREDERARIRAAFDRAEADRRAVLVRIVGEPGAGTTRLAEACAAEVADEGAARAVTVRCALGAAPGGVEALARLLEALTGTDPTAPAGRVEEALRAVMSDDDEADTVLERLRPAVGLEGRADPDETAWALGRFLERAAGERPLVLVLDDADRAGTWFLGLVVEATAGARAPILVLATGAAHGWPLTWEQGAVERIALGPLAPEAMRTMAAAMLLDPEPEPELLDRLLSCSAGNPLALEQRIAAMADRGELRFERRRWTRAATGGTDATPSGASDGGTGTDPTAAIAGRLQDLEPEDRALLAALDTAGGEASPALLETLLEGTAVEDRLAALTARRFLRAEPSGSGRVVGFAHDVLRSAARAGAAADPGVHERCARWLDAGSDERPSRHAAALATHLEALTRTGWTGSTGGDTARRAAGLLVASADRRWALGDGAGAVEDLRRATDLLEEGDPTRAETLLRTATGLLGLGRRVEADPLLVQAIRAAREAGDAALERRARLARATASSGETGPERVESIWEAAHEAEIACAGANDETGLWAAWSARALVHRRWGHWGAAADDAERAAAHAERAGRALEAVGSLLEVALAVEDGPAPLAGSIERCRTILGRAEGRRRLVREVAGVLAILLARHGSFEEAGERLAEARAAAEGTGPGPLARALHRTARVEALAGRRERAEELLWEALDGAVRAGDVPLEGAIGATLADLLVDLGRAADALPLLDEVRRTAAPDDLVTQVRWRSARARALARREAAGGAEGLGARPVVAETDAGALAREAVRIAEQTDLIDLRAGALLALAEVLAARGRPEEAAPFARRALRALERRGASVPAERARAVLASLGRPNGPGAPATPDDTTAEPAEPGGSPDPMESVPEPAEPPARSEPPTPQGLASPTSAAPSDERQGHGGDGRWWSFGRS